MSAISFHGDMPAGEQISADENSLVGERKAIITNVDYYAGWN